MKWAALSILLLVLPASAGRHVLAPVFIEGSIIGVAADSPTQHAVFFVNTYTGSGLSRHPRGQWSDVDVSALVPPGTVAVQVHSLFGITGGDPVNGIANLTIHFRRPGAPDNGNYTTQTIEAGYFEGSRTSDAAWVPVVNGIFQVWWDATPRLGTGVQPAFFINSKVGAYLR